MKKIYRIYFILILILNLLSVDYSFSQGNMKVGAIEVHPRIKVAEEYDDNIFWEPDNEKEDWITILTPGIRFNLPFNGKRHLLSLDYYADIAWFNKFSDQNYQNHYITGLLDLNFPEWYVDLKDKFSPKTSDRAETEFTDRVERRDNRFTSLLGREFNKLAFELGYENFWIDYDPIEQDELDRMDNIGTLVGYVQVLPKTKALLEYNYADIGYYNSDSRDGSYNQVRIGLKGSPTDKMTLIGKVGYQDRNYSHSGEPDWNHISAYLDLVERFTERIMLHLNYALTAEESTYRINNFYKINRIRAELRYRIFTKFTIYLGGSFGKHDYPETTTEGNQTDKRNDDLWEAHGGLRYDIKDWLFTEIEYNYRERDSNLDLLDYDDNKISLRIAGEF